MGGSHGQFAPPSGSSAYLESLMRAGQQSMKQFDDALARAMGVAGKASPPETPPSQRTFNGSIGLRLRPSGKASSLTHLRRTRSRQAATDASRTRLGSSRLITILSSTPT